MASLGHQPLNYVLFNEAMMPPRRTIDDVAATAPHDPTIPVTKVPSIAQRRTQKRRIVS